ncbi:transthyretin domain containing protein [Coccidioides immitis RMSCC 3703]|uniref:Transthyretin domain containing protein n=1 Tax=Coccidioides immitis RMSCC 3703 TaxID=454286 RepID=A0A0J8TYI7_COCIT|nr:transthyretin domain containing protein [Coccidioides immitis RMSCC 3703]
MSSTPHSGTPGSGAILLTQPDQRRQPGPPGQLAAGLGARPAELPRRDGFRRTRDGRGSPRTLPRCRCRTSSRRFPVEQQQQQEEEKEEEEEGEARGPPLHGLSGASG